MIRTPRGLAAAVTVCAVAFATAACSSSSDTASSDAASTGPAPSASVTGSAAPLYDQLPAAIQDKGSIVLGSAIDYPPFEYYAEDGTTLQGFETELMAKVSDQLGVPFEWTNASFDTLFSGLESERYDIVMGAVNDTPEREEKFDFVDYMISSQAFVTKAGNDAGITTEDDLCGKSIAAVTGGVQIDYLNARSETCVTDGEEPIDVLSFDGNSGEQSAVRSGQADAMLEGYATAVTFAEESDGKLEVVPDLQVAESYYGVVVPKGSPDLRDALLAAWTEVIDSGDYQDILDEADLGDIALDAPVVNGATSAPQS